MTHTQLLAVLDKQIAAAGSVQKFAAQHDLAQSTVYATLRTFMPIGDSLLNALGYVRVVTYRRKESGT